MCWALFGVICILFIHSPSVLMFVVMFVTYLNYHICTISNMGLTKRILSKLRLNETLYMTPILQVLCSPHVDHICALQLVLTLLALQNNLVNLSATYLGPVRLS